MERLRFQFRWTAADTPLLRGRWGAVRSMLRMQKELKIKGKSSSWTMQNAAVGVPKGSDAICRFFDSFWRHNTNRSELSQRFIVSLFMYEAIDKIETGYYPLVIAEGMDIECIIEVDRRRGTPGTLIKYYGPVDFAVGNDGDFDMEIRVEVFEVKRGQCYDESEPQVLAQAATSLLLQRDTRGELARDVVHYIRSNGEQWESGRLILGSDGWFQREKSKQVFLNLPSTSVNRGEVRTILSWLLFVLQQARETSIRPRTRE
ncbi:hypothetical protein DFS34DRAFT_311649 [Phlyctochytrium arcticum]|nr:hypothetical protein DFS34DRAFT_311649 [Phlyctochytrium arcticum]